MHRELLQSNQQLRSSRLFSTKLGHGCSRNANPACLNGHFPRENRLNDPTCSRFDTEKSFLYPKTIRSMGTVFVKNRGEAVNLGVRNKSWKHILAKHTTNTVMSSRFLNSTLPGDTILSGERPSVSLFTTVFGSLSSYSGLLPIRERLYINGEWHYLDVQSSYSWLKMPEIAGKKPVLP